MSTTTLIEVAERCEAASGPDRLLDLDIASTLKISALYRRAGQVTATWPDYTASLDAAMTLVPEGWAFGIGRGTDRSDTEGWAWISPTDEGEIWTAATPALALTAACLRARASQGGE
jgi:hypothetical protein